MMRRKTVVQFSRDARLTPAALGLLAWGLLSAVLVGSPASAQAPAGGAPSGPQTVGDIAPPILVPPEVLTGLLAGTPDGMQQLKNFLATSDASPDEMTQRAIRIVQQLKDRRLVTDLSAIIAVVDRLEQALSELSSTLDADPGRRPVDQAVRNQAQLASAIGDLLQDVESAGGLRDPRPFDFGPPVTEPTRVASPS
jgi:hypothetical protein